MLKHIDKTSLVIMVVTVALFAIALVEKGLTHEILLESGVFLISVKLVLSAYKSSVAVQKLERKLDLILDRLEDCKF